MINFEFFINHDISYFNKNKGINVITRRYIFNKI